MNLRVSCLLVLLSSLVPSMYAKSCTLATVAGSYAVASIGSEAGSNGVALFLGTNNAGSFSGAGAENIGGTPYPSVTASGTYSVGTDCTFTSTTTDSMGNTFNISGDIIENGNEIVGISTDSGTSLQFTAYRLKKTLCTEASAAGAYVHSARYLITPYGPEIVIEHETVTSKGAVSGSWVGNFSGTIVAGTSTGTVSVNSNCTGTTTVINSPGGTADWFVIHGIMQNGVASAAIRIDSGYVGLSTNY